MEGEMGKRKSSEDPEGAGESDEVKLAIRNLRRSRIRILREMTKGRYESARDLGLDAIRKARSRRAESGGKESRYSGALDELLSVVENDLDVAGHLDQQNLRAATVGVLETFAVTGAPPVSGFTDSDIARVVAGLVGRTSIAPNLADVLHGILGVTTDVPAAPGTVSGASGRPVAGNDLAFPVIDAYLGHTTMGLKVCIHGNRTFSGNCLKPPCPTL
jgi:hypothetical protein